MADIVPVDIPRPNPDAPSPVSITDVLKRSGQQFDHALFQQRVAELRPAVLDTGGLVFIPLVWGMPSPEESEITPGNEVVVHYEPDYLLTYPENTLRDSIPHKKQLGPFVFEDYTSEPDPMTVSDIKTREQRVRGFERARFPTKQSRFNQMNGMTAMTDEEGNVSISMNCPYPLRPARESPVKADSSLPVPFDDTLTTRIFYAAYLRTMGFDPAFIANALAFQPIPATEVENGVYGDDHNRTMSELREIPAFRQYYTYNPETDEEKWTPPQGVSATPEEVYRTILTTARFQPDGNIAFAIVPPKQPQTPPPVPALPQ